MTDINRECIDADKGGVCRGDVTEQPSRSGTTVSARCEAHWVAYERRMDEVYAAVDARGARSVNPVPNEPTPGDRPVTRSKPSRNGTRATSDGRRTANHDRVSSPRSDGPPNPGGRFHVACRHQGTRLLACVPDGGANSHAARTGVSALGWSGANGFQWPRSPPSLSNSPTGRASRPAYPTRTRH